MINIKSREKLGQTKVKRRQLWHEFKKKAAFRP
jgi:hypothetical protein